MRGFDIDRHGVAWVTLASGHIASFDRRKCKGPPQRAGRGGGEPVPGGLDVLSAPGARRSPAGTARPKGRTTPGSISTTSWASGPNTPIGTGNFSDSLHALTYGKVVELRVPYPMGFFAKGVDGRIDDPKAGWKGRGLWVTSGNRTPMHIEGVDAPSPARRARRCRARWSCTSSCGPIRWRTSDVERDSAPAFSRRMQ